MSWLVGIDVGGTFTDFYALNATTGTVRLFKRPSTPANPAEAIVLGLRDMLGEFGIGAGGVTRLCHGTTVGTNALIQRRGGEVALITTRGFRDLLEIGRQTRPHMYSLQADHPDPLVPRARRVECAERVLADGTALEAPSAAAIEAAVDDALATGAEAVAVCFLFAHVNPAHERRVGEAIARAAPGIHLSLSCEVQPEFREYERFSTTVLNAYLQPVMSRYLGYLDDELSRDLPALDIGIYQSSGGLMSVDTARRFPVRTALSGPAAGAVGASHAARLSAHPDLITLDMGGTSADVALIRNYETGIGFDRAVAGFPVRLPMVDIHTVGAGGGSIAWFDRDGLLKVGPASAGADPGPACYGRGGDAPTVTDANFLLGRLSPAGLVGGRMRLERNLARAAFEPAAARLGYSIERTAHGVLGIVCANMVRAIRAVTVEKGHDPRDYVLMAFGGAGPLHAAEVARSLGIPEVLVPFAPGILCAQGLIVSDLQEDFVHSERLLLTPEARAAVQRTVDSLERRAAAWFEREGVGKDRRSVGVCLDMRYVGQNFELRVDLATADGAASPVVPAAEDLEGMFFDVHARHYGFHNPEDPVEVVNVRLTARGGLDHAAAIPPAADPAAARPVEERPVYFEPDATVETPVYDRQGLPAGTRIDGPAIVQQLDTTTVVHPGDRLRVDDALNVSIEVRA